MKAIFQFLIIYVLIGFVYNMGMEYHALASRLRHWNPKCPPAHVINKLFEDPDNYQKAAALSPLWPVDAYHAIYRWSHKNDDI